MQEITTKQTNNMAVIAGMVIFTALFIGCLVIPGYIAKLVHYNATNIQLFFIARLLFWVCILLLFLYTRTVEKQPLLLWTEQTYKFTTSFKWIIILLVIVFAGSTCINLLVKAFGLNTSTSSQAIKAVLQMSIPLKMLTVVTAAVTEEVLFRGYLMPRLQLFFKSKYVPIIISSLVFGMAHFRYGTAVNIIGPVYIGMIFAFYYQKFHNLKVPIICHFIIDFIAILVLGQ